ncbi:hypothetical protein ACP70R_015945 [Stipagrostis hirtigluma subsp. patula]
MARGRFLTQLHALLLKNLSFQRRNARTNAAIAAFPVLMCALLVAIQSMVDGELGRPPFRCGCAGTECGIQYSTKIQAPSCAVRAPPRWPALVQVPDAEARARTPLHPRGCNASEPACAATVLFTGLNRQLAQGLVRGLFPPLLPGATNSSGYLDEFSTAVPGSSTPAAHVLLQEPALVPNETLYLLQEKCLWNSSSISGNFDGMPLPPVMHCVQALPLWCDNSSVINHQLLNGYKAVNKRRRSNEYLSGYDFLDTSMRRLHLHIWYNSSFSRDNGHHSMTVLRVARLVNMASTAYLKLLLGVDAEMRLEYLKEMPKPETKMILDLTTLLSALFFTWIVQLLLPIVLAFLLSSFFSSVKTASVVSYIYVFGSGLLGDALLKSFIEDTTFPRHWLVIMELVPGFSLYQGIYDFAAYAVAGHNMRKPGMQWVDLNNPMNRMKDVLIIMSIEWIILLPAAFLLDSSPAWLPRSLFAFLSTKYSPPSRRPNRVNSEYMRDSVDMTKPDVFLEHMVVKQLLNEMDTRNTIICHNLKKVYPGKNGNPDKIAVRELSLALQKGECFGMLGPSGAGKTSFINIMIGLVTPTGGTAYIDGLDLRKNMNEIYANIGVCPQHDLLWETLTGREHLIFYGRMKNLTGAALTKAVEESLKSVNLFYSGFGDKSVSKYSGGMKRRLSVAIALIGNPKVVYMDELSTGLDPLSRRDLWNIIKQAKKDCTIILTTHSMEEAEELCDRVGIFIDGNFHCLGTPNELKARYGGTRTLTITTEPEHQGKVEQLLKQLSPGAVMIYSVSGTQKFALPRREVGLGSVFGAVETARRTFPVLGWGMADATLEDVFLSVAKEAQAFDELT